MRKKRQREDEEAGPSAKKRKSTTPHFLSGVPFFEHVLAVKQGTAGRAEGEIPDRVRELAHFADASYKRTKKGKAKAIVPINQDELWKLDLHLTTKFHSVFWNDTTQEVVTAIRGTDVKELDDLASDAALAIGMESHNKRFKKERKQYLKILEKYPEYKHILASHSLGGTINTHLKAHFGDKISEVHNFNPGSGVTAALAGIKQSITQKKVKGVHNYHIVGDPVSHISRNGADEDDIFEMRQGTSNPHSLQQFLS